MRSTTSRLWRTVCANAVALVLIGCAVGEIGGVGSDDQNARPRPYPSPGPSSSALSTDAGQQPVVDRPDSGDPPAQGPMLGTPASSDPAPIQEDLTCPSGLSVCNAECVDLDVNDQNCGGCDTLCAPNELCESGICTLLCATEQSECSG